MSPYLFACVSSNADRPKGTSSARLNLPNWGVVIEAYYDKKLDNLVPGYKVITMSLTNRSVDMIKLDPLKDAWNIEDAWGRKQRGLSSLRVRDAKTWAALPPKVQELIEYPAGVQMGYSQFFYLFYPQHIDLDGFRSIEFYSASLNQNFSAISSKSLEKAIPAENLGGEEGMSVEEVKQKLNVAPKNPNKNTNNKVSKKNQNKKY